MRSTWQRALRPWSDPLGSLCITLHVPRGASGKEPALPMQETQGMSVRSLGGEDPLEEGTAIHSSILACRIPWTEEPGGLHTVHEVQRVGHNWSDLACKHTAVVSGRWGLIRILTLGPATSLNQTKEKRGSLDSRATSSVCGRCSSDLISLSINLVSKCHKRATLSSFSFFFFFWTWDLGWFSGSKSQNKFHTFRW